MDWIEGGREGTRDVRLGAATSNLPLLSLSRFSDLGAKLVSRVSLLLEQPRRKRKVGGSSN